MINRKQVVYKTELYKLYKRKDTWIFLTVILVPILYSVGIASGSEIVSYSGNGNITAINFISAMFQMAQSMFIFNIILVAITSRTLGTEIEDKSLRIYLNKVGDRKKIYIEKVKALSVYAGVISVLLVVVGLFCYYFIMNDKTPIVNGALYDERISIEIRGNQRIIAGNAQFAGIAAGRGVRFTTGLLLLGKGLGMRETPIRPHS